jgi:hypothetical protein
MLLNRYILRKGKHMTPVLAQAIVDVIKPSTPISLGVFKVTVWGLEPYNFTRIYEITAQSDNMAAQQGIRQFENEMSLLTVQGN